MLRGINPTEDATRDRLRKLKVNKASCIDNIAPRLLVEMQSVLVNHLHIYFQNLWPVGSGIAPKEWKYANVTSIFKERD
jgi:hypothetical protein